MIKSKPLKTHKSLSSTTKLKTKSRLKRKSKKGTISWYKSEARKYFNRAIKYRDSECTDGNWVFDCITCGKPTLFKDSEGRFYRTAHAGHFQPETKGNTRFNELNVNGQCGICNFNQGEQFKYAKALDLKYGDGTAEQLEKEAKEPKTWTIPELQQIIDEAQETIIFYERTDKWLKSNPKNQ